MSIKFYLKGDYLGMWKNDSIVSNNVENAAVISAVLNNLKKGSPLLLVDPFSQFYYNLIKGFEIGLPKKLRCHSRKRYVKLLMADGESKKAAEIMADMVLTMNKVHSKYHNNKKFISWQSAYFSGLVNKSKTKIEKGGEQNGEDFLAVHL